MTAGFHRDRYARTVMVHLSVRVAQVLPEWPWFNRSAGPGTFAGSFGSGRTAKVSPRSSRVVPSGAEAPPGGARDAPATGVGQPRQGEHRQVVVRP